MNVALVIYYLIRSVLESLFLFIKHWYFDTWLSGLVFLDWVDKKWGRVAYYFSGLIFLLVYLIWAALPIYLLAKGIRDYANFV